ncbi:MAG: PAS domain S-box protein [Ferruginibacter sp.]
MEDVDRFTAATEAASFNAYNNIQQEKVKKINQQLASYQEELLEAQKLAEMGSFDWDIKNGKSSLTPGARQIFGISQETDLPAFMEFIPAADKDKVKAAMDNAFTTDGLYECEYSYIKDNTEKRIWSRGLVTFEDKVPVSMKGTIMDITKEYKLLASLQNSETLHNQAQALTHIGNWSWSIADNAILWSDEMYRIYGLEPQSETITFDRFMSFVHPDDKTKRMEQIQQSLQTLIPADYLLRIINPDGAIKIIKGKGELVTNEAHQPQQLNGTCQDITKEFLLNKELQEKEQNFKQLIRNAPDAVIVINAESIITLWNPKSEEIFGWTAEEVVGNPLSEIIIPVRYREAHDNGMKRFLSSGESRILNQTLELSGCTKNEEEIHLALTISQTMQGGKIAFIAFLRDISKQKSIQLELQNKTTLLEYKNLELGRINEELESFNFAASHDLQEPLRKIRTYISRITDGSNALSPRILGDFEKIITSAKRMQDLIEDLLEFSHNTLKTDDTTPVDLNELIEDVKNSFMNIPDKKGVKINVGPLPVVQVVPFQFLQLFINLLSNAIKYKKENTVAEIDIRFAMISSTKLNFKGIFPAKNYLSISIADNGIGFEAEYAEKIFDLFTRLHNKNSYSGTGIGLATCKKIIHNHEGFINAESIVGKGSTFHIYLPETCLVRMK